MSLSEIPLEVFLECLLPHLVTEDICNMAMVSKDMNVICDENIIWKELFTRKKKKTYSLGEKTRLIKICRSFTFRSLYGGSIKIRMKIRNTLETTSFDIGWVDYRNKLRRFVTVRPGKMYKAVSYIGHNWVIIYRREKESDDLYQSHIFRIEDGHIRKRNMLGESIIKYNEQLSVYPLIDINIGEGDRSGWIHFTTDVDKIEIRNYKKFKKQYMKSIVYGKKGVMENLERKNDDLRKDTLNRMAGLDKEIIILNRHIEQVKENEAKLENNKKLIDYVKNM